MKIKKPKKIQIINAKELKEVSRRITRILAEKHEGLNYNLVPIVKHLLTKRNKILKLANQHQTPFYLLDHGELMNSIKSFTNAINKYLPNCSAYYAIKVNHHPYILKTVIKNGFGLDVSSERELKIALDSGAKNIVFTGPAKEDGGLDLAVINNKKVIVNIDSFNELERLAKIASKRNKKVRVGVRVFGSYHGTWNKFGIPLGSLQKFWRQAENYPSIKLEGIHSHISWNKDSLLYQKMIAEIAKYLKNNFTKDQLSQISFFDFGGGFRPYRSEGYYPWHTPQGRLIKAANDYFGKATIFNQRYFIVDGVTIDEYFKGIAKALNKHFKPLLNNCSYYTEPGRIICNNAMHIVLKIADVKSGNIIIADGGTNIVGWERFEYDYFPLINLTNPSLKEIDSVIYGSLCLPDDFWGYYCYAKKIKIGDIILVPYQGGLTYSIAQNFIRPIPDWYILN